jgi:hypothetical protein
MNARVFVAGDVVNTRHADGIFCDQGIQEIITSADFSIVNLEAPIQSAGVPAKKSGPVLCQQPGTLAGLRAQGFDAVALANNHIMDFGTRGLEATLQGLEAAGLAYTGAGLDRAGAYEPLVVERNGIRIGIINGCEAHHGVHDLYRPAGEAGYAWLFAEEFTTTIEESSRANDATIVLAHAGLEHFIIPQKEWRLLYRQFCRHGADAVIGSHPHVPQGYERYQDSHIFYSLGNFYFDTNRYAKSADPTYSVLLQLGPQGIETWSRVGSRKTSQYRVQAHIENRPALSDLDAMLLAEYDDHWAEMSLAQYHRLRPLLERSAAGWHCQSSWAGIVRYLGSRILRRTARIDRDLLLSHLLRNESYYFAIRHALALLMQNPRGSAGAANLPSQLSHLRQTGHTPWSE